MSLLHAVNLQREQSLRLDVVGDVDVDVDVIDPVAVAALVNRNDPVGVIDAVD